MCWWWRKLYLDARLDFNARMQCLQPRTKTTTTTGRTGTCKCHEGFMGQQCEIEKKCPDPETCQQIGHLHTQSLRPLATPIKVVPSFHKALSLIVGSWTSGDLGLKIMVHPNLGKGCISFILSIKFTFYQNVFQGLSSSN